MKTALYRHYAADGTLLYIGQSNNPAARLAACLRSNLSWPKAVVRTELHWFDCRADAMKAEREAIQAEAPLHNRRHNRPERLRTAEGCP